MHRLLAKRREDDGFTLIELLVVVVIIGVLVAIAVPVYLNYREGAANRSSQSDIRGAISALEQYYSDNNNKYPGAAGSTQDGAEGANVTFGGASDAKQIATVSSGTRLSYKNNTSTYVLCATNSGGGGKFYVYNSQTGGSVKESKQTTMAGCLANPADVKA
jgi:type IV pilus assembly protein PilA